MEEKVYGDSYDDQSIIKKYSYLFHKYLLGLADRTKDIPYNIIRPSVNNNNLFVSHLHCLDIYNFDNIYGKYMDNLFSEFK